MMLASAQDKSKTINIDMGKLFGDAKDWLESDEVQETIEKIEDEIERMEPEIEKWLDEHWNDQWRENSGDRWDTVNKDLGWDIDQVQEEFDDFFQKNDANTIVLDGSAPNDKFDLEVKNTMSLYDMGIKSGKVTDEQHAENDSARFQKLYDMALQSGKNSLQSQDIEFSEQTKSLQSTETQQASGRISRETGDMQQQYDDQEEDKMSSLELIMVSVLVSVTLTLLIGTLTYLCFRKRKQTRPRQEFNNGLGGIEDASELSSNVVVHQSQMVADDEKQGAAPGQSSTGGGGYPVMMEAMRQSRRERKNQT